MTIYLITTFGGYPKPILRVILAIFPGGRQRVSLCGCQQCLLGLIYNLFPGSTHSLLGYSQWFLQSSRWEEGGERYPEWKYSHWVSKGTHRGFREMTWNKLSGIPWGVIHIRFNIPVMSFLDVCSRLQSDPQKYKQQIFWVLTANLQSIPTTVSR